MLNWPFLKRLLFIGSLTSLSTVPLVLISKFSALGRENYISDFKKDLRLIGSKYSEKFGIAEFTKEALRAEEMQLSIYEIFARDILGRYLERTTIDSLKQEYLTFVKDEQKDFDNLLKSTRERHTSGQPAINRILDENGGSRESMKRRLLNKKSYDLLKKQILNFNKDNFTLNKNVTDNPRTHFIRGSHFFSKSELLNKDNWKYIGLYPTLFDEGFVADQESFQKEKFEFLRYAWEKWFNEVKPFYAWMSLWKYKADATKSELEKVYDSSQLNGDFPNKASYEFPLFDSDDNKKLSTATKFHRFWKNIVSKGNSFRSVPKSYTDDSSTSIYVEGANMYEQLYIKFAAAVNYKYSKLLNSSSTNNTINLVEKNKNPSHPLDLFAKSTSTTSQSYLKVDKSILKQQQQQHEEFSDAVEVKDTPWIFIRNQAGIHGIALDSHHLNNPTPKDIFNHFNFRTLQTLNNRSFKFEDVLDLNAEQPINAFKDWISKSFDRMLLSYVLDRPFSDFSKYKDPDIASFKEVFDKRENLFYLSEKWKKILLLRKSLIGEYARFGWSVSSSSFDKTDKKHGLASPIPYPITVSSGNEEVVFKDLEKLFDVNFYENSVSGSGLLDKFSKSNSAYEGVLNKWINERNLSVNVGRSDFFQSDRIFTNNFLVNEVVDTFLDKGESFKQMLFKYELKNNYLGKSFFGANGYINVGDQSLLIKAPNSSSTSLSGNDFLDRTDGIANSSNVIKLTKDMNEMIQRFYYGQHYLKSAEDNPLGILRHGSGVLKEISDSDTANSGKSEFRKKLENELLTSAQGSFEKHYFLNGPQAKEAHLQFLATLTYLVKDDFKNFMSLMKSVVTPKSDAYFLWESIDNRAPSKLKTGKNFLDNPFLRPNGFKIENSTNKEIGSFYNYLKSHFSPYKQSAQAQAQAQHNKHFYKGLLVLNTSHGWASTGVASEDRDKFVSETLYNFGTSREELNKYVLGISTEEDYKEIVEKIKKILKDNKDKLAPLDLNTIYFSDNNSGYRVLTLEEKKNLLSAIVNSVKTNITDGKISKSQYKDTFLVDPDSNFHPIGKSHSVPNNNKEEVIEESKHLPQHLKGKKVDESEVSDGRYIAIQVSSSVFSNFENFKKYVNENLSREVFWKWVIDVALKKEVQEIAVKDLEGGADKQKSFDKKWKESATYRYAM
nr:DUF3713 domain-containing protein [Mycoplasma haemocanis]